MLKPDQFSLSSSNIGSCSQIVFSSVAIDVDPNSSVVEVARFCVWDLEKSCFLSNIGWISSNNKDFSICVSTMQEPIWHWNGIYSNSEDIGWHSINFVRPGEAIREKDGLNAIKLFWGDFFCNVWDDINTSWTKSSELWYQHKLVLSFKLFNANESWIGSLYTPKIVIVNLRHCSAFNKY